MNLLSGLYIFSLTKTMDFKGDIHTNGAPKSGQDNLLKKDNMPTLEARSFDIKVGNPIDKLDGKKEGKQKPHSKNIYSHSKSPTKNNKNFTNT